MNDRTPPREPTGDECSAHAQVDGGTAGWWPQMGGYAGRCVAVPEEPDDPDSGGVDVWVWHDGQFPFDGDPDPWDEVKSPAFLHLCDPMQFLDLACWLTDAVYDTGYLIGELRRVYRDYSRAEYETIRAEGDGD